MEKREELYHMTQKEMVRLKVAERLLAKEMKIDEAARILNISTRQVKRITERVKRSGPGAVIHANRARKPANATDNIIKDLVVELKKDKYQSANFSHFTELLSEKENITLSQPTVHRILVSAGIKSPKKKKKTREHRYRKRMECAGAMVQIDASPYCWLGSANLNLHGAIDDATGNILGLYLAKEECLSGYFEVARQMVKNAGIPLSIYSDKHTIFFSPKRKLSIQDELEGIREPYTQFSAAMSELGINLIAAGSPQAKGRIERLWATLQDRLVVEFLLNGIKDIDDANMFMQNYINEFNRRFSVAPKGETVFRKAAKAINIDYILCRKLKRKLDNGSALSYKGEHYQLISNGRIASTIPRSSVTVLLSERIGMKAKYSGKIYSLVKIDKARKKAQVVKNDKRASPAKVLKEHPWRKGRCAASAYITMDKELIAGLFNSTVAWKNEAF